MNQTIVTYGLSARVVLSGFFDNKSSDLLAPGDLVKHLFGEGTYGLLISKISNENMTVMWTSSPGQRRQEIDSQNPCGEILLDNNHDNITII